MKVLPKFIDGLLEHYLQDHLSSEKYPATWIDHEVVKLSYGELGVLIGEAFPLIDNCEFEFKGKFDGHNAFETIVAMIFEQLLVEYGVLIDPLEKEGNYTIHAGKLSLLKRADPDAFQSKVA